MTNAPVNPAEVPEFTGNLDELDAAVKRLSGSGPKIVGAAGDVHTTFGGLRAFYTAPEADQLFATTQPVKDTALDLSSDMCVITGALGTYSRDVEPLVERLKDLRRQAAEFRDHEADDPKWREDGDLIDENLSRRNEIAEVWAAFQEAETACHNKIVALVGGKPLKTHDGSDGPNQYGYRAEDLKSAKSLPWGDAVAESTPGWQVWEHAGDFIEGFFVDGVGGTIRGLGTLVGVDGWDAAGDAWNNLAKLSTGSVMTLVAGTYFWTADDKDMPSWLRDSRAAMKEGGKAMVAWDQWDQTPGRAGGAATFNVVTIFATGGAGGAAKGGAVSRAVSVARKVGTAVDPTTYVFKGVGAGVSKIGDVAASLKDMGKFKVPPLPETAIMLPEGGFKLSDGTLHLPEGAALPEGAFSVPERTVQLPDGTPIPKGAIDLGHGMARLPKGAEVPTGAMPVPEGTLKVREGATALPESATPLPENGGAGAYYDRAGNLFSKDGTLLQHHTAAGKETPPPAATPATTAIDPTARPPVREPAMAGEGARATRRSASARASATTAYTSATTSPARAPYPTGHRGAARPTTCRAGAWATTCRRTTWTTEWAAARVAARTRRPRAGAVATFPAAHRQTTPWAVVLRRVPAWGVAPTYRAPMASTMLPAQATTLPTRRQTQE